MGSAYCASAQLLEFIKEIDPENLYIVGDFIDGWKFARGFYWPSECSEIFHTVLKLATDRKVFYAIGNHDEFLRKIAPVVMGGIIIQETFDHTTVDGKNLWIRHGDALDAVVKYMAWLAHLGDRAMSWALWMNRLTKKIQRKIGWRYWSFSNYLKRKITGMLDSHFEELICKEAKALEYDGVICGHIHVPKLITNEDFIYGNCGDWVENGTAIVEYEDGSLQLLRKGIGLSARPPIGGFDWPG